jgi:glycine oxidase
MGSEVAIVGGGIIGCALAYELRARGLGVTVIERDRVGAHASGVAAGMLSPLAESASPGPFVELGLRSMARFATLATALKEETGVDVELLPSGSLRVALTEADEIELRHAARWQNAARGLDGQTADGLALQWLGPDAAHEREPALAPTIRGALLCSGEQQVNSRRLVAALAQAAARRGARFLEGTPALGLAVDHEHVRGVRTPAGTLEAQTVVLAAGPWSGTPDTWAGLTLPVTPKRGQLLHLHATPQALRHMVSARHRYLVPRADGAIILGATVEEAGYDRRPTAAGIAYLVGILPYLAPALALAEFRAVEVGLRPWSPDGLPLLGRAPGLDRLVVATGHGRNGILLSPITAELIAELIADGRDAIPAACHVGRFTGMRSTDHVDGAGSPMATGA